MNKLIINTIKRIKEFFGKGKSISNLVLKDETYDVFSDLESGMGKNTFKEKNIEYSKKFFLNAMNQYECRLNVEFNE